MKKLPKENRPTRFYSKMQEQSIAKNLGGSCQPNSGATNFRKGDVIVDEWLIEAKTKVIPSETLVFHKDWLTGIEEERAQMLKSYCAVCFSFGDGQNYYAVDEKTFKFLLDISQGKI